MGAIFMAVLMDFADIFLNRCTKSVSDMTVANNTSSGAGVTLRLPPPYSVDEYILRWSSRMDARRFSIVPAGLTSTVMVGRLECETAGWRRC